MWNFSIIKALVLWVRTAPILVMRVITFGGIAVGLALATFAGAWGGFVMGRVGGSQDPASMAIWGGLLGIGLAAGLVSFRRGAPLLQLRVGHVVAMVDGLDGRPLPFGMSQVAQARTVVTGRFGLATELLALDRLVRRVIGVVPRLADDIGPILSLPVLPRAASGGLLGEVVLAHAARARPENAWEAAHDGLVLYTQNARPMLATAGLISLIVWLVTGAVFLALLTPFAGLAWLWPGAGGAAGYILAALVAWAFRTALVQPFALACLLQAFLRTTAGQDPMPEWRGRLTQASDTFRLLGERAVNWTPKSGTET